ncbi:Copiatype Polyprotein [Phytophthora palmivora]|uniref:Copiatype Polyprotein n=1 Tax=Phytophthora palmivora TaxID=4796 RepID=A0A2P4XHN3_9STRA|nr:Copiatype Polyprotein [Phytophthora palmivora]
MEGRGIANMLDEALKMIEVNTKLTMGVDNNSAIALAKAPTYNSKTRHIELRWHYVREQIKKAHLQIYKVDGTNNPADMFTKPLAKRNLERYCQLIGMTSEPAALSVPARASEGAC